MVWGGTTGFRMVKKTQMPQTNGFAVPCPSMLASANKAHQVSGAVLVALWGHTKFDRHVIVNTFLWGPGNNP